MTHIEFWQTLGIVLGALSLSFPLVRVAVRGVVRDELDKFLKMVEMKEQSQLKWEGHRLEMAEVCKRYDDDFAELKRRLSVIESILNHGKHRG